MYVVVFFLMIRRPPRSTLDRSSAASDVYKRQNINNVSGLTGTMWNTTGLAAGNYSFAYKVTNQSPVSYTHLRAHETVLDLVCRLLLEKKKKYTTTTRHTLLITNHTNHKRLPTMQQIL